MAATLKCNKIQVIREVIGGVTPHQVTCYATDTVIPGVGSVSTAISASDATLQNVAGLQIAINTQFTTVGLPTVDWTK